MVTQQGDWDNQRNEALAEVVDDAAEFLAGRRVDSIADISGGVLKDIGVTSLGGLFFAEPS